MSENSPINWQRLDLITENDRTLGKEFVYFFLDNVAIYLKELSQNIERADEFSAICHKIKGAANSVGADLTAELSLKGEGMGDASTDEKQQLIDSIKDDVENIRQIII